MSTNNVIILKTDIQSEQMLRLVSPVFDNHSSIEKWSVDLEDCDKVLRLEIGVGFELKESKVLFMLKSNGIKANQLL